MTVREKYHWKFANPEAKLALKVKVTCHPFTVKTHLQKTTKEGLCIQDSMSHFLV